MTLNFVFVVGDWVRARCLNNNDPIKVVLSVIDLGRKITVDSRFIREKAIWATRCPAAVSRCVVQGTIHCSCMLNYN